MRKQQERNAQSESDLEELPRRQAQRRAIGKLEQGEGDMGQESAAEYDRSRP